ncbi:xyloglucan-specific endo-beta-1,4-glucanase BoGH5A precursor [mine drainage metagenome]|uniref:Xyloglucan-specific endo-beta-1,4-glucanase BoGH5A n=1 Tax=mine drainage metagenome TaxID=410659 RepID=A0A1J5R6Z5_9ZZZZ
MRCYSYMAADKKVTTSERVALNAAGAATRRKWRGLAFIAGLIWMPLVAMAQNSGPLPMPTYGWNMGNTLEPPSGPGSWGPLPTQAMLDAVAHAGFNTVRIPCAWNSNADPTTYTIKATYMAQVKQMVDWCLARNMYVMINDHWDGGWLENSFSKGYDATIDARMKSYWTQIATEFKGYDNHLLFAAANEPGASTQAQTTVLLTYYETFIQAVRATGGNNTNRWLVLQAPSTSIDYACSWMTTLPADPTPGRLAVEVHDYTPPEFAILTSDASWGKMFYFWGAAYHSTDLTSRNATWGEEASADAEYQKMTDQFVNKGIPVIVGEFRAPERTGNGYPDLGTAGDYKLANASVTYWDYYTCKSAIDHGLSPIVWDTPMNMFDSNTGAELKPAVVAAVTGGNPLPVPVPDAPTGVTATGGKAQVALTWTAAQGHVVSYNVYRSTVAGGEGATAVAQNVTATSYTDTGLADGTNYYYTIASVNASGTSSQSAEVSALTSGTPTTPVITAQPSPVGAATGSSVTFGVTATGAVSYQWLKDGVAIAGATSASYTISSIQASDVGAYTVAITGSVGTATSTAANLTLAPAVTNKLAGISTRAYVGQGDDIMVAGFAIKGTQPKTILIRASGPALAPQLPAGTVTLPDPMIQLFDLANPQSPVMIAQNDNWDSSASAGIVAAAARVGEFPWTAGSKDAALLVTLKPGLYTVQVSDNGTDSGVALVEVYDADPTPTASSIVDVSTRAYVKSGLQKEVVGFVVSGGASQRVLVRAAGPALAQYISGTLPDPSFDLYQIVGSIPTLIGQDDNWPSDQTYRDAFTATGEFPFADGSKDAALITTLKPGLYTSEATDASGGEGIAIVEVYEYP